MSKLSESTALAQRALTIENGAHPIPALLWGGDCARLLVLVHGAASNKADAAIEAAARAAVRAGYAALSFDLPEHGERAQAHDYRCSPQNGCADVLAVCAWAREHSLEYSVFACSLGAYFSMLAYPELAARQWLFLSGVVNMEHLVEGMMAAFSVDAARLEREGRIPLPNGQTLDWEEYRYIKAHPVEYGRQSSAPMALLYGEKDTLCARADSEEFARWYNAPLCFMPESEHYFHTPAQLAALEAWLEERLLPPEPARWLPALTARDNVYACGAAALLTEESRRSPVCLPLLEGFGELLGHKNSLVRNRAAALIAANARWDTAGCLEALLPKLLAHILDEKPITARQVIKALPELARGKPALIPQILAALRAADPSPYPESMRPLVEKDIAQAIGELERAEV